MPAQPTPNEPPMPDEPITPDAPPTAESDERFPSGPWEGYFLQRSVAATKTRMELDLVFQGGRIHGDGRDGIGPFTLRGGYETVDGKVWWTKRYPWHEVFYQGYAEAKGIWGVWEIEQFDRDGFHIWPKGRGADESERERREESPPVLFEEPASADAPLATVFDR